MAEVFTETEDPAFVKSSSGRLVPRDAVDPSMIVKGVPYQTSTPTHRDATAGAPTLDRSAVDQTIGKLNTIRGKITQLAEVDRQFSVAGAQADQARSQAELSALGAARGTPSKNRDAALSQAGGALGRAESAIASQEATGRTTEAEDNQRFKLAAYDAAGKLGLNTAALDVDIAQLDMRAATNYLNNLFSDNRTKVELNDDQAARALSYLKDMALLEKDYYAMSLDDKNRLEERILARHEIDQRTRVALAQAKASKTSPLEILAGIGQAAIQTGATYYGAASASNAAESQALGQASGAAYSRASNQPFSSVAGPDASGGSGFYSGGR